MVYLHTGTMGVHPACFFIDEAGKVATPARNLAGNHSPYLAHPLPHRAPTGERQAFFSCDVLEHLLVQEQLGDEPLEGFDLDFEFPARTLGVRPQRGRAAVATDSRSPRRHRPCDIRPRQSIPSLGRGRLRGAIVLSHFLAVLCLLHGSLLDTVLPEDSHFGWTSSWGTGQNRNSCILPDYC